MSDSEIDEESFGNCGRREMVDRYVCIGWSI